MRTLVLICFLAFGAGWTAAHDMASYASSQGGGTEVIEEVEVVEAEEAQGVSARNIFGIPRHRWLITSGPIIWLAMAVGVTTRHLRVKGKARQLLRIHRFCGYTALGVGTVHGFVALFF